MSEDTTLLIELILEVLEVSIVQILHYRGIYKKAFFRNSQRYGVTVKECTSPPVTKYVKNVLKRTIPLIQEPVIFFILTIFYYMISSFIVMYQDEIFKD